ncbi:Dps family protein [Deinococcus gobiensis]|uniref:DNA protection during starvation protein 2 n=1 Tax=Deinococcus gobiensis (strain DSM 21396 / JCM 16679 / CGMCC 1.7299 / I-0) TaxID=745776 RepID=H8GXK8_DEIGI|nr:Dps family protein [Deinococcus gobiensis]AFD24668.1 DNA protection during starvation protein 2 [Deinococcus gobiensis I-0]
MKNIILTSALLLGTALAGGAGAQSAGMGVPSTNVNAAASTSGQASAQSTGTASPLPYNRATTLPSSGTTDLNKSVAALQNTLTELQALQLQTKQAHWNVSGTLWYTLHELLQDHYEGISKYADDVAERQLAVGASSDGRAITIVAASRLPEIPGGFLDDAQVISFLTYQYETVGQRIYQRIGDVEKVDPTTANLLQEVEHAIEKYQWQMRAFLQNTPTDPNTGADLNNGRPVPLRGK